MFSSGEGYTIVGSVALLLAVIAYKCYKARIRFRISCCDEQFLLETINDGAVPEQRIPFPVTFPTTVNQSITPRRLHHRRTRSDPVSGAIAALDDSTSEDTSDGISA